MRVEIVNKIVVACDVGMGSSAMGAFKLRKLLREQDIDIIVENAQVDNIPNDVDLVITQESIIERSIISAPNAEHIVIKNFLNDPVYNDIVKRLKNEKEEQDKMFNFFKKNKQETNNNTKEENTILTKNNIRLGLQSVDKFEAIEMAGNLLVESGYVNKEYIAAMKEREEVVTTYIGMGVAIPHGIGEAKKNIIKSGIVVLQFPDGIKFDDEMAYLIVGIAGVGDEHIKILSNIATVLEDEDVTAELYKTNNKDTIYNLFASNI